MRDALRDLPFGMRIQQGADPGLLFERKGDLFVRRSGAITTILGDGLLQRCETQARIVKIGNRFVQPLPRQISEQALERAKGLAGLAGLAGRLNRFE